jgi:hypothetical protein
VKNITINENPFIGFEQFALTNEEAKMVKGGEQGVVGDLGTGGDLGGGGDNGGGYELQRQCWQANLIVNGVATTHLYSCDLDARQCVATAISNGNNVTYSGGVWIC